MMVTIALVISKYTCRNGDNDDITGDNDDIINEAVIVLIEVLHI